MNSIWGAELNYAPDYWPLWLIYAGVIIVLMIAGLVTHALLRRMLAPKRQPAKSIGTTFIRWRSAAGTGVMRCSLSCFC